MNRSVREQPKTLRGALRSGTSDMHDMLDAALAQTATSNDVNYRDFLMVQYRARRPIEEWIAINLASGDAPPPQTHLIASDLRSLGSELPQVGHFRMPDTADPAGLAWALGGSSLGNRAMLAQRRKAGLNGSDAFLSDPAMPLYFSRLRPSLEREASQHTMERAVIAARAVFSAFLGALQPLKVAA